MLPEAIDEFRAASEIDPKSAEAHFNLGVTLARLGRADEAGRHLREALRLRPGWSEAEAILRSLNDGGTDQR